MDEAVMPYISSANIACGWHAGDPLVMEKTVRLAASRGINCGAHPGYPDLLGFGRRAMQVSHEELQCYLIYQIGALDAFCRASGVKLTHVKPHGALYLTAVESEATANAVAEAIARVNRELIFVTLAGQKGQVMAEAGRKYGLTIAFEAFPDRAYTPEGTLAPRKNPGAVITDPEEVVRRAVQMASEGRVVATDGSVITLAAETLCVHGDNPHAVEVVRLIKARLQEQKIEVRPFGRSITR
jgi:UPF0271 protein